MKTKIVFATAAAAVVAASAFWLGRPAPIQAAAALPAPEVTVAQVLVRPVDDAASFTGRLQAVDTIALRPRVSGYVD